MLFIAGINHFDPLGRERLRAWLTELAAGQPTSPSFVAVEFDPRHLEALRAQRPVFRAAVHAEWPDLPASDLDQHARSLGYEGDTHAEVFPDVETLWLDQGRAVEPGTVAQHALQRVRALRYLARHNALMLPGVVSEQVQAHTRPEVFSPERSRVFAERITARLGAGGGRWAVAIVGASHASDRFRNSMRSLLEQAGVRCDVRLFVRLE